MLSTIIMTTKRPTSAKKKTNEEIEMNTGIQEYWTHYTNNYIDENNQEAAKKMDLEVVKDTLIVLVKEHKEIAYDFISYVLSKSTDKDQNDNMYNTICLGFLNEMMIQDKTLDDYLKLFNKLYDDYDAYRNSLVLSLTMCSQPTMDIVSAGTRYKYNDACLKTYTESINKLKNISDIIQFGINYKDSFFFKNHDNFKQYSDKLVKYFKEKSELHKFIIIKIIIEDFNDFNDFNVFRDTLIDIIKYYLDDMILQTRSIRINNNVLERAVEDDNANIKNTVANTIFENRMMPYKYVKLTAGDVDKFATQFDTIVALNNQVNAILDWDADVENQEDEDDEDVEWRYDDDELATIRKIILVEKEGINSIKAKEKLFWENDTCFPKKISKTITIGTIETTLGMYEDQHANIAKYNQSIINDKKIMYNSRFFNELTLEEQNAEIDKQVGRNTRNAVKQPIYCINFGNNIFDFNLGKIWLDEKQVLIKSNTNSGINIFRVSNSKKELPILGINMKFVSNCDKNSTNPTSLCHGDVLCFGPVESWIRSKKKALQNDAIYRFYSAQPTKMWLCGNMMCTVEQAQYMIKALNDMGYDNQYKDYISGYHFKKNNQNINSSGGSHFVTVAGRKRKVIMQKGKKYVNFNSELVLLSKLEKQEAKSIKDKNKSLTKNKSKEDKNKSSTNSKAK